MSDALAGRGGHAGARRIGTVIKGKWQVDARIGAGGMATVYSATHRNGSRVAIKMLHPQLAHEPTVRSRFLREAYAANAVDHPAVCSVLDDGETEDGGVFLVLELLEGETMEARRLRLGGKLPIEEALDIAEEALDALAAAHEKGIIHRDVKPENVFVTNEGRIKLLDFGLARMKDMQSEATAAGITIGTPEFMPPEQAAGRRDAVDARSDIWGLGATVFTAITGRFVHADAQSLHEQLIASATRRSTPIRQIAPQVPPAISLVIDRSLELEMGDRWQSAREMQQALRTARTRRYDRSKDDSVTMHVAMAAPENGGGRVESSGGWPAPGATVEQIEQSYEKTAALPPYKRLPSVAPPPPPPVETTRFLDVRPMMPSYVPQPPPTGYPQPPPPPVQPSASPPKVLLVVIGLVLLTLCAAMATYVFALRR